VAMAELIDFLGMIKVKVMRIAIQISMKNIYSASNE
jgi:hypothetical protein